jgi:AcrR family transcriptional regulator
MTAVTTVDQRTRILDEALRLMGAQGSSGASMRQLAAACDLNVATLYHYFPSKAELLESVLRERRYGERLAADRPPLDPTRPTEARLAGLLEWIWANALEEETVWRLLVGEALRGEDAATSMAAEISALLAATLGVWLDDAFPELPGDHAALARIIRGQVFALVVEHLAIGPVSKAAGRRRAQELAAALAR